MPTTPFSEIVRNLFVFAGNVSEDQLAFPTAVLNARTALKKRLVDLQLSDNNHLLDDFDVIPDGTSRVYDITEPNFGEPVLIQYSIDGVTFSGNIQVVNKANLHLAQADGILKASFYGNPRVIEFSIEPPTSILAYRIYFEPNDAANPRLTTNVDLNNNSFLSLVAIDGAILSLPDIAGVDETWRNNKKNTLRDEKLEWEARWAKWNSKPAVQGVVNKRPYNSRRRY